MGRRKAKNRKERDLTKRDAAITTAGIINIIIIIIIIIIIKYGAKSKKKTDCSRVPIPPLDLMAADRSAENEGAATP